MTDMTLDMSPFWRDLPYKERMTVIAYWTRVAFAAPCSWQLM
ncbi:MAG TPA: hypothetical protein V6C65_24095 [Allocoleopsis sp.]